MRVLVSSVGRDTQPTGICRVAASHVKAMLSNGVASSVVFVIGCWQRKLFWSLLGPDATKVEFVEIDIENKSLQRNAWYAASLPGLARKHEADLVHFAYPAPTLRRSFPCPVVVTLHDLYPYDIPENFGFPQYFANRLVLRQCLSSVDGIVCVSHATRSRLDRIFPSISRRVPTVIAGNYIQTASGIPVPPASLEFLRPNSFLLTVAQHRKNKNLDILLRGYAALEKSGVDVGPLILVGADGPETPLLYEECESLGIRNQVMFIHSISDSELSWLYSNCALFVVCSSIEGYCLPVAEARAAGARVVCSDIATLKEIGGAQCIYFSLAGNAVENLVKAMTLGIEQEATGSGSDLSSDNSSVVEEYSKLYASIMWAH
jgi:glycosyltransferase involved in cell wall biosynthesis